MFKMKALVIVSLLLGSLVVVDANNRKPRGSIDCNDSSNPMCRGLNGRTKTGWYPAAPVGAKTSPGVNPAPNCNTTPPRKGPTANKSVPPVSRKSTPTQAPTRISSVSPSVSIEPSATPSRIGGTSAPTSAIQTFPCEVLVDVTKCRFGSSGPSCNLASQYITHKNCAAVPLQLRYLIKNNGVQGKDIAEYVTSVVGEQGTNLLNGTYQLIDLGSSFEVTETFFVDACDGFTQSFTVKAKAQTFPPSISQHSSAKPPPKDFCSANVTYELKFPPTATAKPTPSPTPTPKPTTYPTSAPTNAILPTNCDINVKVGGCVYQFTGADCGLSDGSITAINCANVPLTLSYVVTNAIAVPTEFIVSLVGERDVNLIVEMTTLSAGQSITFNETVVVNTCNGALLSFPVTVKAQTIPTLPSQPIAGTFCNATTAFSVVIPPRTSPPPTALPTSKPPRTKSPHKTKHHTHSPKPPPTHKPSFQYVSTSAPSPSPSRFPTRTPTNVPTPGPTLALCSIAASIGSCTIVGSGRDCSQLKHIITAATCMSVELKYVYLLTNVGSTPIAIDSIFGESQTNLVGQVDPNQILAGNNAQVTESLTVDVCKAAVVSFTLTATAHAYPNAPTLCQASTPYNLTFPPFTFPPTPSPTPGPTRPPTSSPTRQPTPSPTPGPTLSPTPRPTPPPTPPPTSSPTSLPTPPPTPGPTLSPTPGPTPPPTPPPTSSPTSLPTPPPTPGPTTPPSSSPTRQPTPPPTPSPTVKPTLPPTHEPTSSPTSAPTPPPTNPPTSPPTPPPTPPPTIPPTPSPTSSPTSSPTKLPTPPPTSAPTTLSPTQQPTSSPSPAPSSPPTKQPTSSPTTAPTARVTPAPVCTISVSSIQAAFASNGLDIGSSSTFLTSQNCANVPVVFTYNLVNTGVLTAHFDSIVGETGSELVSTLPSPSSLASGENITVQETASFNLCSGMKFDFSVKIAAHVLPNGLPCYGSKPFTADVPSPPPPVCNITVTYVKCTFGTSGGPDCSTASSFLNSQNCANAVIVFTYTLANPGVTPAQFDSLVGETGKDLTSLIQPNVLALNGTTSVQESITINACGGITFSFTTKATANVPPFGLTCDASKDFYTYFPPVPTAMPTAPVKKPTKPPTKRPTKQPTPQPVAPTPKPNLYFSPPTVPPTARPLYYTQSATSSRSSSHHASRKPSNQSPTLRAPHRAPSTRAPASRLRAPR